MATVKSRRVAKSYALGGCNSTTSNVSTSFPGVAIMVGLNPRPMHSPGSARPELAGDPAATDLLAIRVDPHGRPNIEIAATIGDAVERTFGVLD